MEWIHSFHPTCQLAFTASKNQRSLLKSEDVIGLSPIDQKAIEWIYPSKKKRIVWRVTRVLHDTVGVARRTSRAFDDIAGVSRDTFRVVRDIFSVARDTKKKCKFFKIAEK